MPRRLNFAHRTIVLPRTVTVRQSDLLCALGISRVAFYRWRVARGFPASMGDGRRRAYCTADVIAWCNMQGIKNEQR